MARSSKAGPARSRRRPDPATVRNASEPIALTIDGASFAGAGTADIVITMIDPTTGTDWAGSEFAVTGRASRSYAVDDNNVKHKLQIATVGTNGATTFQQLTGLPAGPLRVFIWPLDPAIRSNDGGWTSGAFFQLNVT